MKINVPGCGNLSLEQVAKCERLEKRVRALEERDGYFVQGVREIRAAVLDKRLSVGLLCRAINIILEDVQFEEEG